MAGTMIITQALAGDSLSRVEKLAQEIWREHYPPIVGVAQVEYMLKKFQSKEAIAEQLEEGFFYYLIQIDGQEEGYLGILPREEKRELFLSKIYLRAPVRGKGYGGKVMAFAVGLARKKGFRKVVLAVNKKNIAAIRAYEGMGFKNVESVTQDIGGGFFLDDYRMEKGLVS
ncbi:MAG TPA: GNAT family N-acetyltransferase [Candidatus Omnitrophota bacterium]|nr:GNAT family N-acetyltransferase [Candidatus Omnitrophota bacterium]HPS37476.1 GNAT family N-acetyltransferase [Candidatus Omnitrophota bacterium]